MSHAHIWWNVWAILVMTYLAPRYITKFVGLGIYLFPLSNEQHVQVLRVWENAYNRDQKGNVSELYTIHTL